MHRLVNVPDNLLGLWNSNGSREEKIGFVISKQKENLPGNGFSCSGGPQSKSECKLQ